MSHIGAGIALSFIVPPKCTLRLKFGLDGLPALPSQRYAERGRSYGVRPEKGT
jgi:hypothetical protein